MSDLTKKLDNRSEVITKVGLTGDNKHDAKLIASMLRDDQDLREFLNANHEEMRQPIYDVLRRHLTFKALPFWALMGLPRPLMPEGPLQTEAAQ